MLAFTATLQHHRPHHQAPPPPLSLSPRAGRHRSLALGRAAAGRCCIAACNLTVSVRATTHTTKAATASVHARRPANSANSLVYARNIPTYFPNSLSTTSKTYEKGG
jgi:hypothetical protein